MRAYWRRLMAMKASPVPYGARVNYVDVPRYASYGYACSTSTASSVTSIYMESYCVWGWRQACEWLRREVVNLWRMFWR